MILHKQLLGNEYVNNFNSIILHVFRCNHDVHLLMGSSGITFYALKYSVKPQHDTNGIMEAGLAA